MFPKNRDLIQEGFTLFLCIVFWLGVGSAEATEDWHLNIDAVHGYTDNLFYTADDKASDYWLSISPQIWFAIPSTQRVMLEIETDPLNPSGVPLFAPQPPKVQGASAYARYAPTFDVFGDNDSENTTHHLLEGMLQFGFVDGPQLSLIDRYEDTQERRFRGIEHHTTEYQANLFQAKTHIIDNETNQLRFDYAHYSIRFEDTDAFRDRADSRYDLFLGAKVAPQKMIYAEYILVRTDYENQAIGNNEDRRGAVGVDWEDFFHTSGRLNMGVQMKIFENNDTLESIFFWEVLVIADLSARHQLRVFTDLGMLETDVRGTQYIESSRLELAYQWKFTPGWVLEVAGDYIRDDYGEDIITLDGQSHQLISERTSLGTKLIWQLSDKIELSGGYRYETRNSNFPSLEYTTNRFIISVATHF